MATSDTWNAPLGLELCHEFCLLSPQVKWDTVQYTECIYSSWVHQISFEIKGNSAVIFQSIQDWILNPNNWSLLLQVWVPHLSPFLNFLLQHFHAIMVLYSFVESILLPPEEKHCISWTAWDTFYRNRKSNQITCCFLYVFLISHGTCEHSVCHTLISHSS